MRWLPVVLVVLVADWWLWHSGIINGAGAVALFLGAEACIALTALLVAWRTGRDILPLRLIRHELGAWADLARLLRGRRVVPEGSVALPAQCGWWHLPVMISVATAIEITAIELLLPWPTVRLVLLLLSIYSLLLLWGYVAAGVVHPHFLGDELVLRRGRTVVARIPLDDVQEVRSERTFEAGSHAIVDTQLILGGPEGTNVRINCSPTPALLPRWPWQPDRHVAVTRCALWLDAPESLR